MGEKETYNGCLVPLAGVEWRGEEEVGNSNEYQRNGAVPNGAL